MPVTKTAEFTNSIDPDEASNNIGVGRFKILGGGGGGGRFRILGGGQIPSTHMTS